VEKEIKEKLIIKPMRFKNRKLISSKEDHISIIQFIGFGLILIGIGTIIAGAFINPTCAKISSIISVAFFITMFGFAFAFPSMLEGNDGLSTMRIVVFMVVNVICLLLLKIGWGKDSLTGIGVDEWWMGIIAFVFGAKATQSYFESKLAVPKEKNSAKAGVAALEYSNAEIAKLAVAQNEQFLKVKFPNIVSVSDAVHDLNQQESHVVAIYLKDDKSSGIPDKLEVKMPDGNVNTIGTEIVMGVGSGKIQVSQNSVVDTGDCKGSVCCVVDTNQGFNAIITAGHVYSKAKRYNCGGKIPTNKQTPVNIDNNIGNWFFQFINYKNDIALASLPDSTKLINYISFKNKTCYQITDADIKKTQVKLVSHMSGERTGYILDYNTCWDVEYSNTIESKNNIIVIGSTNERISSKTVSLSGDSGGCVYEPITGNLIGLILGGNDLFTWVLPFDEILLKNNFTLI
jgi:hypothetical protein